MDQAHHGLGHGVEQTHGQTVLIAENAPTLEPPNAMFHLDPSLRQLSILCPLFWRQFPPFGFFVGGVEGGMLGTLVGFVGGLLGLGVTRLDATFLIEAKIGFGAAMAGIDLQELPCRIGDHLGFEGMPLLLARVSAPLAGLV